MDTDMNFIDSWAQKIELIRDNLRKGNYSLDDGIFPILKELIANADDARAHCLTFALTTGIQAAHHPLLRSPGMLVCNDGPFDASNAKAIRTMGLSSKGEDLSTIGKFGLGMKSVFHLGEIFLYVVVDGSNEEIDASVRNPWSSREGGLHPDWDQFVVSDRKAIVKQARAFMSEGQLFCLWVPLRTKSGCGSVGPIERYFPGDLPSQNLLGSAQFQQVASILPLLSSVEIIQFRIAEFDGAFSTCDIRIPPKSTRRADFDPDRSHGDHSTVDFHGEVAITCSNEQIRLRYAGTEYFAKDHFLAALKEDVRELWPRRYVTDVSTGDDREVLDKACQHSSVCVSARQSPDGKGQLRIHWAVFLPLGRPETISLDTLGWDIDVFLHGWFFPNSGRTAVEGLDEEPPSLAEIDSTDAVRSAWNHRLARHGTLPMLPAVLSAIAGCCSWDDKIQTVIIAAVQRSKIFERFRIDACRNHSFVRCMTKTGVFEWQLVPSTRPVVTLPNPSAEIVPSRILPTLSNLSADRSIVLHSTLCLTPSASQPWWPITVVRDLIQAVSISELTLNDSQCAYFFHFLDWATARRTKGLFPDELVSLANAALRSIFTLKSVREPKTVNGGVSDTSSMVLRQILSHVPDNRRISLGVELVDDVIADLYLAACKVTTSVVWIPGDLLTAEANCDGQLEVAESYGILQALSSWWERKTKLGKGKVTPQQAELFSIVAAQVFRATSQFDALLERAGDLELFSGTNCRKRTDVPLSWRAIVEQHRRRSLFVKPSPMAYQLQEALATDSVLLLSKDLVDVIFSVANDGPSQCRESQMLSAFTADEKPKLSAPSQRIKLFATMLKFAEGRRELKYREAVRYLLHGDTDCCKLRDPLFVQVDTGDDVWWRIARISLDSLKQKWRVVDPVFSSALSLGDRREFDIENVDAKVAARLAADVKPEAFQELRPSTEEYKALLKQIDDDKLLRCLPIHKRIDGTYVSVSENSYWEGNYLLPDELASKVIVLETAGDEPTRKRQLHLASPLNAAVIIDLAITQSEPVRFWRLIMDCVKEASPLPEATITRLKAAIWVPKFEGPPTKPEDILHLPELGDDIARLVSKYPGVFVNPEAISTDFRAHSAYSTFLAQVVPGSSDALAMLGTLLLEDERNAIGEAEISFEDWLSAFHTDDGSVFPHIALLRAVRADLPFAASSTFGVLQVAVSAVRLREFLAFLQVAHGRSVPRRKIFLRVFGHYLQQLISSTNYVSAIVDIDLPTSDGGWRPSSEVCLANEGVSPSYVLDPEIEKAITCSLPSVLQIGAGLNHEGTATGSFKSIEPSWDLQSSAERLREYFEAWRDLVPNEQIGGFLALLGDDEGIRDLAQAYLGCNRTLEETRGKFGLPDRQCGRDANGQPLIEDAQTLFRRQRVAVEILTEPTVFVLNLLGDRILVPRNLQPSTIFVGYGSPNNPFPHRVITGPLGAALQSLKERQVGPSVVRHSETDEILRVRCFRLNAIVPDKFSESELGRLLRDSAIKFIGEAYSCFENQTRIPATWDELGASDQLDIRITQTRIIEHGFLILDQYGLRRDPELARVLYLWDAADRLKREREAQNDGCRRSTSRDPERELDNARLELRRLFEAPPVTQTQRNVLIEVQHRIRDYYQYQNFSIPFELFQNADDAYAERDRFFSSAMLDNSQRVPVFKLRCQSRQVTFIHSGRRINQYPQDLGRSTHGFDNDLWKMAVLSLSNKGNTADADSPSVTGKFGLGFKSVYLVCDRPRLLSGRLVFEFVGGIYPRRLVEDERKELDEIYNGLGERDPQVTIIDLRLRDGVDQEQLVRRFQQLSHILVVFAKRIRQCIFNDAETVVHWQPTAVPGIDGCHAGYVQPVSVDDSPRKSQRVLQFDSNAGSLLFALNSRGIEPFCSDIPTVWVTAPTEEPLQVGFLVNGPFALDVGRAQLARDLQQNASKFQRLGEQFAKQLEQFFAANKSNASRTELWKVLGFAADITSYEIWNSFWERLVLAVWKRTSSDQPADHLIRSLLWQSSKCSVAQFYSQFEVIPVNLPGKAFESELVCLNEVKFAIKGVLGQSDKCPDLNGYAMACIRGWPAFVERVGERKLVSCEQVREPLEQLCPELVQNIERISLIDILKWECTHSMIDEEKAELFGELLTRNFVHQIADQIEQSQLRGFLETLEFLGSDGHYHPARELLIPVFPTPAGEWSQDECHRTRFAPRSRVLSDLYGENGLRFFAACRLFMSATSQDMTSWIRDARDLDIQKAALVYLADGDAGRQVQVELRRQGLEGTWLHDLAHHKSFCELTTSQQHRIADLLSRHEASVLWGSLLTDSSNAPRWNARNVLQSMHDWWTADGAHLIREYDQRVYPSGRLLYLADQADEHIQQRRKEWMTLFMIGLTHTMGRTFAEQHRNFLSLCDTKGWLNTFCDPESSPSEWIAIIDGYWRDKIEDSKYLQWMKQFVCIRPISLYLDAYSEVFLSVNRTDFHRTFRLTELTNTRASTWFQGGGVSAPPLSRMLGMGQCFVLRELFRHGLLSNQHAHSHCFVPVGRVRKMLIDLGCSTLAKKHEPWEWSRMIHEFLREHLGDKAAIFEGAFDIPLQIVADDVDLQLRFFNAKIETDEEESTSWYDKDNSADSEDE
jgi:hypothetical protein